MEFRVHDLPCVRSEISTALYFNHAPSVSCRHKTFPQNATVIVSTIATAIAIAMRTFSRKQNDGLVLDDVRDLAFLVRHQDKLQGKCDNRVEFASTPGGQCAYSRWLFRVPVVATFNYSTANLDFLETDDFLGTASNRVLVHWPPPARAAASG